jgi:DNA-binding response OmpR family regulator
VQTLVAVVFIIAGDWRLRALVRAELRERGIEALAFDALEDAAGALARGIVPQVVVLENLDPEPAAALVRLAERVPVILVASRTQTTARPPGIARVLYRPVRIADVVAAVEELLQQAR